MTCGSRLALGDVPAYFKQLAAKVPIPLRKKHDLGHVLGRGAEMVKLFPKGGSGSSLYRTLVAEVTFHRPCAPEECAWGAVCSPEQFRTHLCSRYHFRVYPGAGLANACPSEQEITMNCDVFRKNVIEARVD